MNFRTTLNHNVRKMHRRLFTCRTHTHLSFPRCHLSRSSLQGTLTVAAELKCLIEPRQHNTFTCTATRPTAPFSDVLGWLIYDSSILAPLRYVFVNREAGAEVTQVLSVCALQLPSLPPVAPCIRAFSSMETSEKVFVPQVLSGVPVATNWDA